jgi:hypothetical protein
MSTGDRFERAIDYDYSSTAFGQAQAVVKVALRSRIWDEKRVDELAEARHESRLETAIEILPVRQTLTSTPLTRRPRNAANAWQYSASWRWY